MSDLATATEAPLATADDLLNAPSDIVEEIIDVPKWGRIKIRSLTAAQQAKVNQASFLGVGTGSIDLRWEEMEKLRFQHGVVEPKLSPEQVNVLYHRNGPTFGFVLSEINRISGTSEEELRKLRAAFREGGGASTD